MSDKNKTAVKEWLKQSDYDIDTAEFMYGGGRYFYSVFMCLQTKDILKWIKTQF